MKRWAPLTFLILPLTTVSCVDSWARWAQDEPALQDTAESLPTPEIGAAFLAGYETDFEEAMRRFDVPGAALAVVADDEILYSRGFGHRDLRHGRPVTTETLFRIGSASRALSVTMLGALVDEGRLDWDRSVQWQGRTLDGELHDLLDQADAAPRDDDFLAPFVLGGLPAEALDPAQPSDRFAVTTFAGIRAAGDRRDPETAYRRLMHAEVFGPAGMARSTVGGDLSTIGDDYARPYAVDLQGEVHELDTDASQTYAPWLGIASTVIDMAHFAVLQINEGIAPGMKRVISPANLEHSRRAGASRACREADAPATRAPAARASDDPMPCRRELGWTVQATADGDELWILEGGSAGYSASVAFLARRGVGWVVLSNKDPRAGGAAFLAQASSAFVRRILDGSAAGSDDGEDGESSAREDAYALYLEEVRSLGRGAAAAPSPGAGLLGAYQGGWSLERRDGELMLSRRLASFPVSRAGDGLRITGGPALGTWIHFPAVEADAAGPSLVFKSNHGKELARLRKLGS